MAKKNAAKAATAAAPGGDDAPLPVSNDTAAKLRKLFGDAAVVPGSAVTDRPREVIKVSPRLDFGLGGGLLKGTIVTMAGPSGCGKTSTALHVAGKWQRQGGRVFYLAAEHRIFERDLTGVPGFDPAAMQIVWSHEGHIMTAQDFLLAADTILRNEKNALVIVDSFSILSEQGEMAASEYGGLQPGGSNRLVGSFCRRMAPVIPVNGNMVIGIAHFYTNIGPSKKKWAVSLGSKVNYARATGLVCDWAEPIMSGEKPVGQTIHWKVERTPLGPPNVKVDSVLTYGEGIDELAELVGMACDFGLAKKEEKGGWITLTYLGGEKPPKVQGVARAKAYLREHPEALADLEAKVAYCTQP